MFTRREFESLFFINHVQTKPYLPFQAIFNRFWFSRGGCGSVSFTEDVKGLSQGNASTSPIPPGGWPRSSSAQEFPDSLHPDPGKSEPGVSWGARSGSQREPLLQNSAGMGEPPSPPAPGQQHWHFYALRPTLICCCCHKASDKPGLTLNLSPHLAGPYKQRFWPTKDPKNSFCHHSSTPKQIWVPCRKWGKTCRKRCASGLGLKIHPEIAV